jgi:hypothetical protein
MASWIKTYFMLSSLVLLGNAVSIARNEFKPSAVNYVPVLDNTTSGKRVLTDNTLLTITGGFVVFLSISPGDAYIYYDGYDNTTITMNFLDPVSALGMDWISNDASPTLSVYNAQNVLLDSLTLDWTQYPKKGSPLSPYGFIGIDVGQDAISYATIDTPIQSGNELFVGAWIYQSPGVTPDFASPKQSPDILSPEPSPSCEHCNEAYRTEECQVQEKQHPDYLSVDIMDCNYGDIDEVKAEFGCVQYVPGCDTWLCTVYIPEEIILKLSSCPPVIVGSL